MAATQSDITTIALGGGQGGKIMEVGVITWTSTTATVELKTNLSVLESAQFTRIGAVDASDAGLASVSETVASGKVGVTAGAFTVVRQPLLAAGSLTGEAHFYQLIGY